MGGSDSDDFVAVLRECGARTEAYGDGQTQSYSFDPMDNRLSKQDSATGIENFTYNLANMMLTRGSNFARYENYSNRALRFILSRVCHIGCSQQ